MRTNALRRKNQSIRLFLASLQVHLPPIELSKWLVYDLFYFFFCTHIKEHLEEWKKGRDMSLEQQALHVTSFQEQAQALMEGLSDMQTLLEEKEFQLWEKEGLLEYQEERLMNSEDLELEMANFINEMAQSLLQHNASLPAGLEEKPYYGSQLANVDDDPSNGEYGEENRHRRLRSVLPHVAQFVKPVTSAKGEHAALIEKAQMGTVRQKMLALRDEGKL